MNIALKYIQRYMQ